MKKPEKLFDVITGKAFRTHDNKWIIDERTKHTLVSELGREVELPEQHLGKIIDNERFEFIEEISNKEYIKYSELRDLLKGVDAFSKVMKERLILKSKEGSTGYKKCSLEEARYEASQRMQRLRLNEEVNCDIGIANWMCIHWLNRQK